MDTIGSFQKQSAEDVPILDIKGCEDEIAEEIHQIFESPGPYSEEFSLQQLFDPVQSEVWKPQDTEGTRVHTREVDVRKVRDTELRDHREESFPHVHHPLMRSFHHTHHKGRRKGHHNSEGDAEDMRLGDGVINVKPIELLYIDETPPLNPSEDVTVKESDTLITPSSPKLFFRGKYPPEPNVFCTDDEQIETTPLLNPEVIRLRSCIRSSETDSEEESPLSKKGSRVQFNIGSDAGESELERQTKSHKKRKHRKHREKVEFPEMRRHLGSETGPTLLSFSFTTTEDEAKQLKEHDLDQISSHRVEDHRHHRIRGKSSLLSIIHPSDKMDPLDVGQLPIIKKIYDHSPHEVFVELAELQPTVTGGLEWKETARWIKYEEDVEGADNRWGQPHIAFLNFNSLFNLRKGLEKGVMLLDLDEHDLPSIASRVVDHMVSCDQIPWDQRDAVIKILLLRHKHIKEHLNAFRRASRLTLLGGSDDRLPVSYSSGSIDVGRRSLASIFHVSSSFTRNTSISEDILHNGLKPQSRQNSYTQIEVETDYGSADKNKFIKNLDLLKKIPEGAEATAVLVGAVDFLKQPTIAFVRLSEGLIMENIVEVPIPVRFLFVLLGPFQGDMDYHEVGRSISTLMADKTFHEVAYRAHSKGQLLSAINEFLNSSIVFPPSEWNNKDLVPIDEIRAKCQEIVVKRNESLKTAKKISEIKTVEKPPVVSEEEWDRKKPPARDPLKRVGKPFYGIYQDVKIRYSQYWSDLRDGLSLQVLSAAIFIFFATLSPAITFGGMYANKTEKLIGVGETLLVSSINGLIFAFFAGQPLIIVGSTGPLMIFDMSLLKFCESAGLDFLALRIWIAIWLIIFGIIIMAFELLVFVKKFTRFTEEIFAAIVCLIYIYGAIESLVSIFQRHPLSSLAYSCNDSDTWNGLLNNDSFYNDTDDDVSEIKKAENQPNTALLSMCLMLGTFIIAMKLRTFRNSKYLGRPVRRAIGDFGVAIAIFLMVLLDFLIKDTYTDKLAMPKGLQPSNAAVRGWIINPLGQITTLPVWSMFAACPASLLLFILFFLEGNISQLILSKPERGLKKGTGFHLDIFLSCVINLVASFLGAPFMGPACVRTISHMSALTIMSSNNIPGESPKIVGCIEQRVSAFLVSLLIGLAVMLYMVLNLVPNSVLYGVFLYMGVSAGGGLQLMDRTILFFMPVKYHPKVPYVKIVRTWKIHIFTGIQLLMLGVLWGVMQSPASLCMPFILLCLIPIRLYILPFIFAKTELIALDGADQSALDDDEPDFYEAVHALPTQIEEEHNHQS